MAFQGKGEGLAAGGAFDHHAVFVLWELIVRDEQDFAALRTFDLHMSVL